jgi:hypothetical protein
MIRSWRHVALSIPFLAALGVAPGGCTSITAEGATQCRSQQDCLARGPDFAETTCSKDRVCVKIAVNDKACETNAECTARNGSPSLCRKSDARCVSLTSTDCTKLLADKEDLLNENTVYVGMLLSTEINASLIEPVVELARVEIKRALGGGLPPRAPGGPPRPLAILECPVEPDNITTLGSLSQTRSAIDHLARLEIPAVLGPQTTVAALPALQQLISLKIAALTSNSTTEITTLADDDLVFRTGFSDRDTLQAVTPFLDEVITPRIFSDGLAPAGDPIKVLALAQGGTAGASIVSALPELLRFNGGKTPAENGPNFSVIDFGDAGDRINDPDPNSVAAIAIQQGIKYQPHYILWASTPGSIPQMIIPFNKQWPATAPRPFQMTVIPAMATNMVGALTAIGNDTVRQRYFGFRNVGANYDQATFDTFLSALYLKFPDLTSAGVNTFHANYYDGLYVLAYAIAAIGDAPVDSTNVKRGIRRVTDPGGVITPVGSVSLPQGLAAVQSGKNVTLQGVTGLFSFDSHGDRPGAIDVFCVAAVNGKPSKVVRSGWSYDPTVKKSSGVVNCP